MIGRAVRKSRRVITVSEAVRSEIAAEFRHGEKIAVTYNGVDPVFLSRADGEGSPQQRSFPFAALRVRMTEGPYFLFVGNDKPHKNIDRLVEAFSRVTD